MGRSRSAERRRSRRHCGALASGRPAVGWKPTAPNAGVNASASLVCWATINGVLNMRIFLTLSVLLVFVALAWSDDLTADKQERSFTMQAHPELSIRNGDGRTVVRAHDSADIVVRYTKVVTHVKTQDEAKKHADRVSVEIQQIGNRLNVVAKYPKQIGISFGVRSEVYVNFEVLVPSESDVQVSASDGDTEIDGIHSHTDLSLSDGD